jgi:hypothetical protein
MLEEGAGTTSVDFNFFEYDQSEKFFPSGEH